jgi:RNA polymerase sigma-70 factor (ECF subfamily)
MTDTVDHRIKMGDEMAFELLYRRYFLRLCAFANKFLGDPRLSEEAVQDIFLKLWENRTTLWCDGSGKSFLFQSVHNRCLNIIAHKKVVNTYSKVIKTAYSTPIEFDVHESLMAKELNSRIRDIINDLAPECKRIFLLSREDGKKQLEIAGELKISVKTVETQINRALKKLRAGLGPYITILTIVLFINI